MNISEIREENQEEVFTRGEEDGITDPGDETISANLSKELSEDPNGIQYENYNRALSTRGFKNNDIENIVQEAYNDF